MVTGLRSQRNFSFRRLSPGAGLGRWGGGIWQGPCSPAWVGLGP